MKQHKRIGIKPLLKNGRFTRGLYSWAKLQRDALADDRKRKYSGVFINRSHSSEILLIVLAGYKDYLYEEVFPRIEEALLFERGLRRRASSMLA